MKVLGIIKKIIIGILAVAFFGFAIIMTVLLLNYNKYGVSQFDNTSLVLIKEDLSSENFKKGDLVLVERKKISNINIGDELFVYKVDSKSGAVDIELGTVGEISLSKDGRSKDDAIAFENGDPYAMEFVIGEASKVYNNIGTYLSIIESKWGFLFMILVPSFLVFIYQLYALIIEIKYGNQEA